MKRAIVLSSVLFVGLFACADAEQDEGVMGAKKKPTPGLAPTGTAPSDDAGTPPDDSDPGTDTGTTDEDTGAPSTPPADPPGPSAGGGTGFSTPQEMFDWVNSARASYGFHIPFDGYPFTGKNAPARTWALAMTWDADLAKEAQKEADALAAGGKPKGMGIAYNPPTPGESMWLNGLETPKYMVSALSSSSTVGTKGTAFSSPDPGKWHLTGNAFFRVSVAYQTGTAPYNHKSKLGVGMATVSPGNVWWVLLFGE